MEHFIQHWINRVAISPFLDHFMAGITNFAAWLPLLCIAVLAGFIFGGFRIRAMLLCLLLTVGFTDGILVHSIKETFRRLRPFQAEAGIRVVKLMPAKPQILTLAKAPEVHFSEAPIPGVPVKGRSFPSGHTTNIFVAATILFLFYRRQGFIFYTIAFLVLYSRVYTGAHWPTDVFAGACLGIFIGVTAIYLASQLWKRWGARWMPHLALRHPSLL